MPILDLSYWHSGILDKVNAYNQLTALMLSPNSDTHREPFVRRTAAAALDRIQSDFPDLLASASQTLLPKSFYGHITSDDPESIVSQGRTKATYGFISGRLLFLMYRAYLEGQQISLYRAKKEVQGQYSCSTVERAWREYKSVSHLLAAREIACYSYCESKEKS